MKKIYIIVKKYIEEIFIQGADYFIKRLYLKSIGVPKSIQSDMQVITV